MDEAKAFCQRARLKINMPLAAGVSGAIVLKAAGLDIDPDSYNGVEKLIGTPLFTQLKAAHPNAFKDAAAPAAPSPIVT